MWQYLVVEYMATHQTYVPVSSRTVHEETSEICQYLVVEYMATHQNMFQYLLIQNMKKHQKYVPVSSCRNKKKSNLHINHSSKI